MTASAPIAYCYHEGFDLDQGDIILAVMGQTWITSQPKSGIGRQTPAAGPVETWYFKVHGLLLKSYSDIFADMLKLGNPSSMEQSVDLPPDFTSGLPIVVLHDNPQHFANFLKLIYCPETLPLPPHYQETFDVASSILKLADKYHMPKLTKLLIPHIQKEWPVSLVEWDEVEASQRNLAVRIGRTGVLYITDADVILIEPAGVISFERGYPMAGILPSAFYHLSRLSPGPGPSLRTANWSLLDHEDYRTLMKGQGAIRSWVVQLATSPRLNWDCPTRGWEESVVELGVVDDWHWCRKDKVQQLAYWERHIQVSLLSMLATQSIDVLYRLQELWQNEVEKGDDDTETDGLCGHCHQNIGRYLRDQRDDFWEELPGFFGLAPPEDWGVDSLTTSMTSGL